jgi:hypothetical protein
MTRRCRAAVDQRRHRVRRGATRRRRDHFDPIDQHLWRVGRGDSRHGRSRPRGGRRRPRRRRRRAGARHDGPRRGRQPLQRRGGNRGLTVLPRRRRRGRRRRLPRPGRGGGDRRRGVGRSDVGQSKPPDRLRLLRRSIRQAKGRTGRRRLHAGGRDLQGRTGALRGFGSDQWVASRTPDPDDRGQCGMGRGRRRGPGLRRLREARWALVGWRRGGPRRPRRSGRRRDCLRQPGRVGRRRCRRRRRRLRGLDVVEAEGGTCGPDRGSSGSCDQAAHRR